MNIENITNPGADAVEGDWIRITRPNGTSTEKQFHEVPEPSEEELANEAIDWRDGELEATDWVVPVTDYPQHSKYMAYRRALRDWPADAENFPANKPTLGAKRARRNRN